MTVFFSRDFGGLENKKEDESNKRRIVSNDRTTDKFFIEIVLINIAIFGKRNKLHFKAVIS
jgi:hypothetical protein